MSWSFTNDFLVIVRSTSLRLQVEVPDLSEEVFVDVVDGDPGQDGWDETESEQVQDTVEHSFGIWLDHVTTFRQTPGDWVQDPDNDVGKNDQVTDGGVGDVAEGLDDVKDNNINGKQLEDNSESEVTPFISGVDQSTDQQTQNENRNGQESSEQVFKQGEELLEQVGVVRSVGEGGVGDDLENSQNQWPTQVPSNESGVEDLSVTFTGMFELNFDPGVTKVRSVSVVSESKDGVQEQGDDDQRLL